MLMRMDVVPVDYGISSQIFHLTMWSFQFITGVNFMWYYVLFWFLVLLVCVVICIKLRIYGLPLDTVKCYCLGCGYIWQAFIMMWMLISNKYLSVSHRKQFYALSDVSLVASLMDI